jgi:2-hydroxy-4-carboxymuconate semialdehyde hemiacetal dehydrogenase
MIRVAVAGAGAFGIKHLDALARIDDVKVVAIVSRRHLWCATREH